MKQRPKKSRSRRVRQRLLNGSTGDPALLVRLPLVQQTFLFDCGFCPGLSRDDYRSLDAILVTHTHLDHFIGFDAVLRMNYGENRAIRIFGPAGIIDQVHHKLHGYTWNLKTEKRLAFQVTEVREDRLLHQEFHSLDWFDPTDPPEEESVPTESPVVPLIQEEAFEIRTTILDHKTPTLAFSLKEADRYNLSKKRMKEMGLRDGRWCGELKERFLDGDPPDTEIEVWDETYTLEELSEQLIERHDGYKLTYATDLAGHDENRQRLVALAEASDRLYCEAFYLDREAAYGRENAHLTARQAGWMARKAEVGQLVVMHFSKRYGEGLHPAILREARSEFPSTIAYFPGASRV